MGIHENLFRYLYIVLIVFSCSGKKEEQPQEITVFCAASLQNVLGEIKEQFEKEGDVEVLLNFASSGTLARQIENGARADIYISANPEWMDYLSQRDMITGIPSKVATNELVLVVPASKASDSTDFLIYVDSISSKFQKLAIGDPGHVPAGKYAKECLEFYNLYDHLKDKLVLAKDVRSALMFVEIGEVDAGFVYLSDALSSGKVKCVAVAPDDSHSKVEYKAALLGSPDERTKELFEYISGEKSSQIWSKYGFKH